MAEVWQALNKNLVANNMEVKLSEKEEEGLLHLQKMIQEKMVHIILTSGTWNNDTYRACVNLVEENGKVFPKPCSVETLCTYIQNVLVGKEPFAGVFQTV